MVILFMFIKHYKTIDQESYLLLCIIFSFVVILMDYYLIDYHPGVFATKQDIPNNRESFEDLDNENNEQYDQVDIFEDV